VSPGRVTAGNQVALVARIENRGPATARAVVFRLAIPDAAEYAGVFPDRCGLTRSLDVRCGLGPLSGRRNGRNVNFVFVYLRLKQPGAIAVTARAASSAPDRRRANNVARAAVDVSPGTAAADLSIAAAAAPELVAVGDDLAYAVTVRNEGPTEATGVALSFLLPPGLLLTGLEGTDFEAAFSTCGPVFSVRPLRLCLGTIAAGASASLRLTAMPGPRSPTPVSAAVLVTAATDDPDPRGNVATVVSSLAPFTPLPGPDLALSAVTASQPSVNVNQDVSFSFVVKNLGLSAATQARYTVTTSLPVTVHSISGGVNPANGALSSGCQASPPGSLTPAGCTLSPFASGARWEVELEVQPTTAGALTMTVNASADGDANLANNSAAATVEVSAP
jgi:uncharacterized repeat protein (TIGR01451 family)